ncbi:hypothetical protein EVAR_90898_1 [Eumeta japonica]|uniref:Histone-lysine N-methyltransferase SETMAR n=1 Tax=Eumeta variegata TaxID=151549 RepID=A0A4C2A1L0_EUMVA|nr:hypothetical protein EVAR_90898_1 [Eumeta japonica]
MCRSRHERKGKARRHVGPRVLIDHRNAPKNNCTKSRTGSTNRISKFFKIVLRGGIAHIICYEGRLISPRPKFFRNLRLVYDGQKWARYFNKDERAVKMILAQASCDGSDGGKCSKIEKLVLADRRIKLWQIAEELQISKERVGEIIHEHMNMRKSVRWVPK